MRRSDGLRDFASKTVSNVSSRPMGRENEVSGPFPASVCIPRKGVSILVLPEDCVKHFVRFCRCPTTMFGPRALPDVSQLMAGRIVEGLANFGSR